MFSDKTKKPDLSKEQNKIAKGTTLKGDIDSEGNFRIDGNLTGSLTINGKVVIGESGFIEGEVTCENADIQGSFEGKLKVSKCLSLKSTAQISGEVIADQLIVEAGASFNATCQMSSTVKTLDDSRSKQKKSKIA